MRLYYWFKGAPEDRIGGPWWYRNFCTYRDREVFLRDVEPFLCAYAETDGSEHPWVEVEGAGSIVVPPQGTIVSFPHLDPTIEQRFLRWRDGLPPMEQAPEGIINAGAVRQLELYADDRTARAKEELRRRIALYELMMSMSERYYSAGWTQGLEYKLWSLMTGDGELTDQRDWDPQEVKRLQSLSTSVCGWWRLAVADEVPDYDHGRFVDKYTWGAMYQGWTKIPQGLR